MNEPTKIHTSPLEVDPYKTGGDFQPESYSHFTDNVRMLGPMVCIDIPEISSKVDGIFNLHCRYRDSVLVRKSSTGGAECYRQLQHGQ
jgi:hypothetical protein